MLKEATSSFEECHLSLIDTIDDEDALQAKQDVLDGQMDIVQDLAVHLQTLIDNASVPTTADERKTVLKRINRLDRCLSTLSDSIRDAVEPDLPHLKQFDEQVLGYKGELADVNNRIFSLNLG